MRRRFLLPPGYSMATKGVQGFRFTKPNFASVPDPDPEATALAAWADAGLPAPVPVYEDLP